MLSGTMKIDSKDRMGSYPLAGFEQKIIYSVTATNETIANRNGEETIFAPQIVNKLDDVWTKMQSSCNIDIGTIASRITDISHGGVLDASAKTITWNAAQIGGNIEPGQARTVNFTIDYSWKDTNTNSVQDAGEGGCPQSPFVPDRSISTTAEIR